MSIKNISWRGADTDRKPSASVWSNCPFDHIRNGVVNGVWFEDNFQNFNVTPPTTEGNWSGSAGGYAVFSSTGGTITPQSLSALTKAGLPTSGITIASDDDNEGVGIRTLSTPFALNRANQRFWFECCIKKSSIANTIAEFFIGLMENTALTAVVPITTTAATLADKNLFGFYSTESAGSNASVTYKADGVAAVVVSSNEITFTANTFTKLGIKYEPNGDAAGSYALSFYQDGTRLASTKIIPDSSGTDFPTDVAMGPALAIRNAAGSSPGNVTIQWWRAAQLYAPLN